MICKASRVAVDAAVDVKRIVDAHNVERQLLISTRFIVFEQLVCLLNVDNCSRIFSYRMALRYRLRSAQRIAAKRRDHNLDTTRNGARRRAVQTAIATRGAAFHAEAAIYARVCEAFELLIVGLRAFAWHRIVFVVALGERATHGAVHHILLKFFTAFFVQSSCNLQIEL